MHTHCVNGRGTDEDETTNGLNGNPRWFCALCVCARTTSRRSYIVQCFSVRAAPKLFTMFHELLEVGDDAVVVSLNSEHSIYKSSIL